MNRMKIWLLAMFLLACGGQADSPDVDDTEASTERPLYFQNGEVVYGEGTIEVEQTEESGDIGQSAQPLIFPKDGAGNPGIKPGSYRACTQWDSGQNCVVPDENNIVFTLYNGNAGQKTLARSHLNQWWIDMGAFGVDQCDDESCWEFREEDLNDPDLNYVISIDGSTGGVCPGPVDDLRRFYCWGGQTTGIAKDNASGLFGTYHRFADHIVPAINVDMGEINALPRTIDQKFNILRATLRAIMLNATGRGLKVIGDRRCDNAIFDMNEMCIEDQAEVCWMNNFGDEVNKDKVFRMNPQCGS